MDPRHANFEHYIPVFYCEMCNFKSEDEDEVRAHAYFGECVSPFCENTEASN